MTDKPLKYELGWVGDLRRDERWREGRLATVRFGETECSALTGDLSLGGIRLALYGAAPTLQVRVEVEIAFEDELIRVSGTVLHVNHTPWGSVVGIGFDESGQTYLARRFLSSSR